MENNVIGEAAVCSHIVLEGKLVVMSPLCIGDGSGEESQNNSKDLRVQKNKQGHPFIPGTSLCGVLRCFVNDTMGSETDRLLFGGSADRDSQSIVHVFDTVLEGSKPVFRDGVAIDYHTGVAKSGAKYDYEVVDAGEGTFRMEAVIRQCQKDSKEEIRKAIIRIKNKMADGIQLGAMTAKGLGLVKLQEYSLGCYDLLDNEADVKAWFLSPEINGSNASDQMQDDLDKDVSDEMALFEGEFELRSTMIICTDNMDISEMDNEHIDKVFLKNSSGKYVVPGSSIKGVLRHQAHYILGRLCKGNYDAAEKFLNKLMGYSVDVANRQKSRFYVAESILNDVVEEKVNTRNRIDRITGGVMDNALFTTVPVYQKEKGRSAIKIKFCIKPEKNKDEDKDEARSNPAEIGLALLLFRDLWQGRIAIGGETGVGRGTLKGISGSFTIDGCNYTMNANGEIACENGHVGKLDEYVRTLAQEVG